MLIMGWSNATSMPRSRLVIAIDQWIHILTTSAVGISFRSIVMEEKGTRTSMRIIGTHEACIPVTSEIAIIPYISGVASCRSYRAEITPVIPAETSSWEVNSDSILTHLRVRISCKRSTKETPSRVPVGNGT